MALPESSAVSLDDLLKATSLPWCNIVQPIDTRSSTGKHLEVEDVDHRGVDRVTINYFTQYINRVESFAHSPKRGLGNGAWLLRSRPIICCQPHPTRPVEEE
jgi:hypothetical protein